MHAAFHVGDTQIMATDGKCSGKASFSGVTLTLNATSNAEADKLFNALAQGGKVNMPMRRPSSPTASAWSPTSSACRG